MLSKSCSLRSGLSTSHLPGQLCRHFNHQLLHAPSTTSRSLLVYTAAPNRSLHPTQYVHKQSKPTSSISSQQPPSATQPAMQYASKGPRHSHPHQNNSSSASSSSSSHPKHPTPPKAPSKPVTGMLTVDELKAAVKDGRIDQVIMSFPDMYGRLMGKRFDADFFLSSALEDGTHACDYLLANDMEMQPQDGYAFANWERGFGDFHLVPDFSSLRWNSWQAKAASVMCDIYNDKTHALLPYAPRSVLQQQITRAAEGEYTVNSASELEYYTYEQSYRAAHKLEYAQSKLTPVGDYLEDYHLLQTAREEKYTSVFRRHLSASGIPVENSKGECGLGQHELNVRYADILSMADRHAVYKQCIKEVSDQLGVSVTFMAKPFTDATGSGCHLHLSMWDSKGKNAFVGDEQLGPVRCSTLFRHFLAGWLHYTPDCMVFYAPTINSYKRFVSASWAPTRLSWSYDNRTAGYRVVGSGQSLRIECRIPGADCNIYLAFAASLASGLKGVKDKMEPPAIFEGNIYEAKELPEVPKTLRDATDIFEHSDFAKGQPSTHEHIRYDDPTTLCCCMCANDESVCVCCFCVLKPESYRGVWCGRC